MTEVESKHKFGWSNWKFHFIEIKNDSGWVIPMLKAMLLIVRILDPLNILKWTFFSLSKSKNLSLNDLKNYQNVIVDFIVVFKLFIAIMIFYTGLYEMYFWLVLSIIFAITSFSTIPEAILFERARPKASSYTRATVLGVINYIELIFHFATFYASSQCLKILSSNGRVLDETIEKIDYLYFSFITVSTIGYGHLSIIKDIGYKLVMTQAFIFLMFILVFFNLNLNRVNADR